MSPDRKTACWGGRPFRLNCQQERKVLSLLHKTCQSIQREVFFYLTVFIVFIARYKRKGRLIFFTYGLPGPYGGTKILHTPLSMGAGQGRGGPVQPLATVLSGHFFVLFQSRSAPGSTSSCIPYYGEQGAAARKKRERSKKLASGAAASPCRFRDFVPAGRVFLGGQAGRGACGSGPAGRCPAQLSRTRHRGSHRGKRPPDTGKGPRKTGALADVGLSGPQAWAVPVRAASRKGDQPAGRPARRAPGSCRCCDRW